MRRGVSVMGKNVERIAPQQVGKQWDLPDTLDHLDSPGYYAARLAGRSSSI